jgi:cell division protein ZapA (FtsZ GTPase activity inhibitor)
VSETISIKVQIGNRTYPLKISGDQEMVLQKAAQVVNSRLKEYETTFKIKDPQDLLAMCALQIAAEQLGAGKQVEHNEADIKKELNTLAELVSLFNTEVK